ncbi:ATP-dependent helicase [Spiroplasma citri]|uniref:DNA 3'-5' helicase n=1 Tax=Spiroplasma citri TaxID=2133 RepID=A0AAJ4JY07_SPICI|nr:UvrD-helicase domain-containing protein [Spiroplasma citri]APE74270.1 putative ATP-dependent DNA helicase [Spiroplasma citri]QED24235.1 AAA family ATPase [Spiroplasma citri]QIA66503.1 AAA family ATPase [Spiroplasma citri]QIA68381.1 AAA family ATPase [Spiroplasma citri]QIA70257.1 UvrD-helicase domain-containing protein [Spiroplasma citri]
MFNEFIENLNPNQREAVLAITGPVRIIAGAGSGKTRIITNKIAYLIKYANLQPWRICAVTFTNKATNEMKTRIVDMIGNSGQRCLIATYHALCVRILREDIIHLNYDRQFNIIDMADQDSIIRNIYKTLPVKYDAQEAKMVKNFISKWKNDFISPNSAKQLASGDEVRWAEIYDVYEKRLREINSVDFNDLILLTYKLFKNNVEVLKKWQNRFDYFLVDEFQDTNELQFDIIKWLVGDNHNITVVGDPDQTIYSWRGAKINLILNFDKYFPHTQTIILNENYRSTQNILSLANNLIIHNKNRIEKDLFTIKASGQLPILYHGANSSDESDFVAHKIKTLMKEENYNYNDILILYRANYLSRDLEGALADYGLSYRIFGAFKFYERKEIKDALAFLKIIMNNDPLAIERILLLTPKIGPKAFEQIMQILKEQQIMFTTLLEQNFDLLPLNLQHSLNKLREAIVIALGQLPTAKSIESLLVLLLDKTGYLQRLRDNFEEEREENILELIASVVKFDKQNKYLEGTELLNEYLQLISLQTDSDSDDLTDNTISLMTIHNAKGLEKKVVFIVGLNEGIFPTTQAIKMETEQLEEERRALYVAITRAKELLFISYADGYSYITGNERFESRFIKELNGDFYEKVNSERLFSKPKSITISFHNQSEKQSRTTFHLNKNLESSFKSNPWKVNDTVSHELFGIGVVVKIIAQNVQIAFPSPYNIKIISADSQAIKKVE